MFASVVKAQLSRLGVDIKRLSPLSNFGLQAAQTVALVGADTIIDVGANAGQFAAELRAHGCHNKIISFEPLSLAHEALSKAAANDAHWVVHPRTALGAEEGEATINIAGNSASSSLLPMNRAHSEAAPYSAYVGAERVAVTKLDIAVANIDFERAFLKIDTQGFELDVLRGATLTLGRTVGLLIEMSLVELYEGQPLWFELIEWLKVRGFALHALNQGFVHPETLRTLQVDGVFVRSDGVAHA